MTSILRECTVPRKLLAASAALCRGRYPRVDARWCTTSPLRTVTVSFKHAHALESRTPRPRASPGLLNTLVNDDGSGAPIDAVAAIARHARRVLIWADVGVEFTSQALMLLGRHPDLVARTRMAGITDEWLAPLSEERREKFLKFAILTAQPEFGRFIRALRPHRALLQRLHGPLCADLLLSGRELHSEAFFSFFRTRLPFLPHLRRVGWLPSSSRKSR